MYGYGICIEQGVSDRYSTIRFAEENMSSTTRTYQEEKSQTVFINTVEKANIGASGIEYPTTYSDNMENDPDYALGVEAAEKMLVDIEHDEYGLYEAEDRGTVVDGFLLVADMMALKVNCLSFVSGLLEADRATLIKFGTWIGGFGLLLNIYQTWIAFSDGDVSAEDIGLAVITAFNLVGILYCACLPVSLGVMGTIGTITSAVGLASDICSLTRSTIVRVSLKNGKNVYVYIS